MSLAATPPAAAENTAGKQRGRPFEPGQSGNPNPSRRRQDREAFASTTLPEIGARAFALIDGIDPSARPPAAADIHNLADRRSRPGEHGLDRAATPVAHPAFEPMI